MKIWETSFFDAGKSKTGQSGAALLTAFFLVFFMLCSPPVLCQSPPTVSATRVNEKPTITRHPRSSNGRKERARAWLGLLVQDVLLRGRQKSGGINKVMVSRVIHGGPADKAGIKPGDFLTAFDGISIIDVYHLQRLLITTPVGKSVTITITRQGREMEIPVTVGKRMAGVPHVNLIERLGISVAPPENPSREGDKGVVIRWVDPYGPMGRAGFEPQDMILEVNGIPIQTEKDLNDLLRSFKPGDYLTFCARDHRTHRKGYVQIRLP